MSEPAFRLAKVDRLERSEKRPPLGQLLVDAGLIDQNQLWAALDRQDVVSAPLGEILIAEGLVRETDVLDALAYQHQALRVDLAHDPPAMRLAHAVPAALCVEFAIIPWRRIGQSLWIATTRPDLLHHLAKRLGLDAGNLVPVIAPAAQIQRQIGRLHGGELAAHAITRLPAELSARSWGLSSYRRGAVVTVSLAAFGLGCILLPNEVTALVLLFGVLTLAMTFSLKCAAFFAKLRTFVPPVAADRPPDHRLPRVSVMVPLYKEKAIAGALIKRLEKLTYPRALLDVVLVLEAKDKVTRDTIEKTALPPWISVIEVPDDGTVTTKPRALNYALDFCRGSIVGIWDAEDAPEPGQLEKVVARFLEAPEHVACLQGVLDYYNNRSNWIARCFTIEYATWWRLIMPGLAKLGFVIPLGGTTLFFRRHILESLGAWDAHNVTEDADLGVRLARMGYVTELIPTVTYEEANCRALPWIRQRSRWLKGFLITYLVHMRRPRALLRDLGLKRFLGIQVMFFATVSQFAAMPFLWSFWLPVAGYGHPVASMFGWSVLLYLGAFFLLAELMNIVIAMVAVSGKEHRHLLPWVLTMPIYFSMGAFAAYKALFELVVTPFYWDKTEHGVAPH